MLISEKTVFRLSGCPGNADEAYLTKALSDALGDIAQSDVRIQSLAMGLGLEKLNKTATLMFNKIPAIVQRRSDRTSWCILPIDEDQQVSHRQRMRQGFILDTHFGGFTPLNDTENEAEAIDCIATSGLASHPFESWQGKEPDRSYMWVRDALPVHVPNVRAIIYGHDTKLVKERSFQTLADIAGTLRDRLLSMTSSTAGSRPILFLAHGVDGVILKKTLVMLADYGPEGTRLLERVYGGILFGVPNHGMDPAALVTAAGGQPNQALVSSLTKGAQSLAELDKHFSDGGRLHGMSFNWAYETKRTRTISIQDDGSLCRDGPWAVLVSGESATRGLLGSNSMDSFAIDKDHSDMVKFSDKDPVCEEVLVRLHNICVGHKSSTPNDEVWSRGKTIRMPDWRSRNDLRTEEIEDSWTQDLMRTLFVPEMDGRFAMIEDNSNKTFEWIFDPEQTNFTEWLSKGKGVFWIQGKPGSGKSTLMKFIVKDERTEHHLEGHDLISRPRQTIITRHFFHEPGTEFQRSFEGLLRSLIFQVLAEMPQLSECITPFFQEILARDRKILWTSSNLRKCIHHILGQSKYDISWLIVLDALDEFQGTPSHISDFLEDLLRYLGDHTRIHVLISSRPWEAFHERFGNSNGLRLQERTEYDIDTYCKNVLSDQDPNLRRLLRPLVPEIVRRAEGVFIWVRYTLEGLISAAAARQNEAKLKTKLGLIPADLVDYYTSVIHRIRTEDRLDAYVLFQLVVSQSEDDKADSMDVLFAHSVWRSKTIDEARRSFDALMHGWEVPDWWKRKWEALRMCNESERTYRLVRNRLLINRNGSLDEFEKRKPRIAQLSGGLIHIVKAPVSSRLKDMLDVHLNTMINTDLQKQWWKTVKRSVSTDSTEEDQESFWVEPSHQTVYDFIKRPEFRDLVLGNEAEYFHENRYTWLAKVLLAQGLLTTAGPMCLLSELTTGQSMIAFIDSITDWKAMYEKDFVFCLKKRDNLIDSALRFAVTNGLTLYLQDAMELNPDLIRTTKEELILIDPWGFGGCQWKETSQDGRWKIAMTDSAQVHLERHLDTTRLLVEGGYNPQRVRLAYFDILDMLCDGTIPPLNGGDRHLYYDCGWSPLALEAKATLLIELGQDPNVLSSGIQSRALDQTKRSTDIQRRPIHVASLAFARILHNSGADLNGEDQWGNTTLDWLLAPWDTGKSRKQRGLAHRFTEQYCWHFQRNRWGLIAYLIENGGVARTTATHVWQSFISRHQERLVDQDVTMVRGPASPSQEGDSTLSLRESRPQHKGGSLYSSLGGMTIHQTIPSFSDVVTKFEAGDCVTYTNLGDDGNLLDSYFRDLKLAEEYVAKLPVARPGA